MQVVGDAVGEGAWRSPAAASSTPRGSRRARPDIWRDIAATNADEIGPALDALIAVLKDLRGDLPRGDRLAEVFTAAGRWRDTLKT